MGEIGLEAGAEIDVPPPEPAEERLWVLVVMGSELAVFAGILGHRSIRDWSENKDNTFSPSQHGRGNDFMGFCILARAPGGIALPRRRCCKNRILRSLTQHTPLREVGYVTFRRVEGRFCHITIGKGWEE